MCWSYMHSAQYLGRTYKVMCQAANCLWLVDFLATGNCVYLIRCLKMVTIVKQFSKNISTLVEKGDRVTALFDVCMNQLDAQINL